MSLYITLSRVPPFATYISIRAMASSVKCDDCITDTVAVSRCNNPKCAKNMCEEHAAAHNALKSIAVHEVVAIEVSSFLAFSEVDEVSFGTPGTLFFSASIYVNLSLYLSFSI